MALPNLPIKTGHLFIGLAILMGVMTMFLFGGKKPVKVEKAQAKILTQSVVVPLVPISAGKMLTINDVTSVKWPSEFLPKGNIFEDPYQVVGRMAKQDLFPGEPVFIEKLSGSNTTGGMPAMIPRGMRAVTIAVTEIKGVAGFVKPGDRVDVLTTFEQDKTDGGGQKLHIIQTVLQNVLVLASAQTMVDEDKYSIDTPEGVTRGEATPKVEDPAADKDKKDKVSEKDEKKQEAEREKEAKREEKERKEAEKAARLVSSVTLALTPEQAEMLALAEESGDLRLSLRSEADHIITKLSGLSSDELMTKTKPFNVSVTGRMPAPPKLPSKPSAPALPMGGGTQVEFIQGTDKTTYSF